MCSAKSLFPRRRWASAVRARSRVRREISFYRALLADPRTPRPARWLIGAGVGYLVLPFDLIPDFIPLIGKLDDLLICSLLIGLGLKLVPRVVMLEDRRRTDCLFSMTRNSDALQPDALPTAFGISIKVLGFSGERLPHIATRLLRLVDLHRLVVVRPAKPGLVNLPYDSIRPNLSSRPFNGAVLYCRTKCETTVRFLNTDAAYLALQSDFKQALHSLRLQCKFHNGARLVTMVQWPGEAGLPEAGAHAISPSQLINLILNRQCEAINLDNHRGSELVRALREFLLQEVFSCQHRLEGGDVVAWNPRRILLTGARPQTDLLQFVLPASIAAEARVLIRVAQHRKPERPPIVRH